MLLAGVEAGRLPGKIFTFSRDPLPTILVVADRAKSRLLKELFVGCSVRIPRKLGILDPARLPRSGVLVLGLDHFGSRSHKVGTS